MKREPSKDIPIPAVQATPKDDWVTQTRAYRVITPLFGGGEETQKADSITVVRATEVRGHLRFWWRATRGGNSNGDLEDMRKREENIWGSLGEKGKPGPSKVIVRIIDWKQGKPIQKVKDKKGELVDIGEPGSRWSYAAFPLRKQEDEPAGSVLPDVYFSVKVDYPQNLAKEIEAAIWAWEAFGGIGARTRRGFGALHCVKAIRNEKEITPHLPAAEKVEETIKNELKEKVITGKWPKGVPRITGNLLCIPHKKEKPEWAIWEDLFRALQNFRQKLARYDRKTGKQSEYGLSRWPEANAIRTLYGLPSKFPEGTSRTIIKKFPRGVFGLPIGFEMHHDKSIKEKPELRGVEHDRLASPLILRPVACQGGAVGLAVILEWEPIQSDEPYTPPGGLMLKGAPKDPPVTSKLESAEAAQIPPLSGEKDVLQAFLNFLKNSGGSH